MTDATDFKDTVFLPVTPFPMKAGLPQKEPAILAKWQAAGMEQQIRAARAGREKFILHDGPPYANGDMHIGHALNHILKDMVIRTQTLKGRDAPYVPGWDCHGLPIEWKVEEQYRKKKLNKDEVDPAEFRAECRAYAQGWVDVQREQLKRLGIGGDWDHPYLTMDFQAEATIVAELLKFAESGQLYRGAKPVMWSPVEKTALAEAEIEYEDIVSTQVDVAFEIVDAPNCPAIQELLDSGESVSAVIWTTTPWTIPVNQALAYGPEVEYSLCELAMAGSGVGGADDDWTQRMRDNFASHPMQDITYVLVGTALISQLQDRSMKAEHSVYLNEVGRLKGSALEGATARHPMAKLFSGERRSPGLDGADAADATLDPGVCRDTDAGEGDDGIDRASPLAEFFLRPRPFLPGDFVTTDSGTGLVHMAPDHGEDDFDLCKAHGLEPVFAVEGDGKYRADWAWLGGQGSVINPKFNAPDGPICSALRDAGALMAASADYRHSYPHSWRSKAKVIYRCTPQWFIPMDRPLPHLSAKTASEKAWEGEGGAIDPADEARCASPSLRETAMAAIADTRWVPEKGRNRINAMVEGRPDWVISRQRAWGVPITLFVDRRTGQYLVDADVNARIVAAVRDRGVDAWSADAAADLLGPGRDPADYEQVTDILDVWFDSGCTHAFVLESGRWPALTSPADLYLEGSDQHRGWFQSSLLQSCGTRGRAPYRAVLTHGFTMDQAGKKMSKSLGNTIDPLKLMQEYGADIIRLWALSVDFTEDHRIGKEILAGVGDQYRKLRNTFRYLLGALDGFGDDERVAVADMPELERYMLHLLARLDATLAQAVDDFDFNTYVRALTDFANNDLSAFFFDIRKDCLYCDMGPAAPLGTMKRRAYRTVLDTMFHALVRYAAPMLVFTAEEVWGTRYPDGGSVHLLEWPDLPAHRHPGLDPGSRSKADSDSGTPGQARGDDLVQQWERIRAYRSAVTERIEPLRRDKAIRSSLEAEVHVDVDGPNDIILLERADFHEVCIVASLTMSANQSGAVQIAADSEAVPFKANITITPTTHSKCGRCWRHLPDVADDGGLCGRCDTVLGDA